MKKLSVYLPILVLSFFLTACIAEPDFNGSRMGNQNQLILEYQIFNTTDTQLLELTAGDVLNFEVVSNSGSVAIVLEKYGGETIYEKTDVPTSAFQVAIAESGRYKVSVTGSSAKGSISITKTNFSFSH